MATHGAYDPDEPEGSRSGGSQYVSKKDAKWVLIIIVVLGAIFYPVYISLKAQGEKALCSANMQGIFKAMTLYAQSYDDRVPPLYDVGENGSPVLVNGLPVVWSTRIEPMLSTRHSFTCPTAKPDEHTVVTSNNERSKEPTLLDYGIYRAFSAAPFGDIPAPDVTILLAETANHGAGKTYNPIPYTNSKDEEVPFDGFSIGWDTSNFNFNRETTAVTRLAFYNTADGNFSNPDAKGRHAIGINAIFADGHLGALRPSDAKVRMAPELLEIQGYWRASQARVR